MKSHLSITIPEEPETLSITMSEEELENLRQKYLHILSAINNQEILTSIRTHMTDLSEQASELPEENRLLAFRQQLQNPKFNALDSDFISQTKRSLGLGILETIDQIIAALNKDNIDMENLFNLLDFFYLEISSAQIISKIDDIISKIVTVFIKKVLLNFTTLYEEDNHMLANLIGMGMSLLLVASSSQENTSTLESFQMIVSHLFFKNINQSPLSIPETYMHRDLLQKQMSDVISEAYEYTYLQLKQTFKITTENSHSAHQVRAHHLRANIHLTHRIFLMEHLNFCILYRHCSLDFVGALHDRIRRNPNIPNLDSLEEKNPFQKYFDFDFINMLMIFHEFVECNAEKSAALKSLYNLVSIYDTQAIHDAQPRLDAFLADFKMIQRVDDEIFKYFTLTLKIIKSGATPIFYGLNTQNEAMLSNQIIDALSPTNHSKRTITDLFANTHLTERDTNDRPEKNKKISP